VTYHVIAATMIVFYAIRQLLSSSLDLRIGIGFFIWISVIALFVTSVFWSFMADNFRSDQAKRLFGFIGVGGTLGSITGSALTSQLAKSIGTSNLLLVSAIFFEIGVFVVSRIPRSVAVADAREGVAAPPPADERQAIGGSAWSGIYNLLRSPYLLGIATFLIIYTIGSTLLYAQQTDMVGKYYADRALRTQILARVELAVQVLTLVTQIFFTGRIIRWIGLGAALAILPLVSALGFGALGLTPVPAVLFGFMILRRGSNFALTNPSMEALFTVVSREDKYKAKSFIETFIYRGGDQIGAWTYAGLTAVGLTLSGVAFAAVPLCAVWLLLGFWLGRRHTRMAQAAEGVATPHVLAMSPSPLGQAR
jgi:ATP:ADP antiporter, AAA family